jgi:hypothetical protein
MLSKTATVMIIDVLCLMAVWCLKESGDARQLLLVLNNRKTSRVEAPNARTDRRGRPVVSELETDTARPRSVQ